MKRLIVKQTSLERKLAAQRYMTNILEVKIAAQTKELEAEDEKFKGRVTKAARQWKAKVSDEFEAANVTAAADEARVPEVARATAEEAREPEEASATAEAAAKLRQAEQARKAKKVEEASVAEEAKAKAAAETKAAEERTVAEGP